MGRKPVVLLPGLICNERGHDADVCDPVCNDFEPICNDCEPEPKTQLQSICARLSDDCDPAAGCLQVITDSRGRNIFGRDRSLEADAFGVNHPREICYETQVGSAIEVSFFCSW